MWRDEANTLAFAAMPNLRALWTALPFDSAPPAAAVLARAWLHLGLTSDPQLRVLGALIGLGVLAALGIAARVMRAPLPLATLAVFALNAWVIRGGDALRPQGPAMLMIVLAFAATGYWLAKPRAASLVLALASVALAVQCAYTVLPLVAALALGVLATAALARARERAMGAGLLLAAAALALLPYAGAIGAAQQWGELVRSSARLSMLGAALRATADADLLLWSALVLAGLFALARAARAVGVRAAPEERTCAVFAGVTLIGATAATLAMLAWSQLPTQPWYYLPLLALATACLDALLGSFVRGPLAHNATCAALLALTAWHVSAVAAPLATRQTNMDLLAARVDSLATPNDLVVLAPWQLGVSYQRYGSRHTPWLTLPPLRDSRIHRYDLAREAMRHPECADSVSSAVKSVFARGGRVFVVGGLPGLRRGDLAPLPPAAPAPGVGWNADTYNFLWGRHLVSELLPLLRSVEEIQVNTGGPVSTYENASLFMLEGPQVR